MDHPTKPSVVRGVPVPESLRPNTRTAEFHWWKEGVRAAQTLLVPLLDALSEDSLCHTDHDGDCQEHSAGQVNGTCANAAARDFLRATGPSIWASTLTSPDLYWCFEHRPALAVTLVNVTLVEPAEVTVQCAQCGRTLR